MDKISKGGVQSPEESLRSMNLFVACHAWVIAFDAGQVERLVAVSEMNLVPVNARSEPPSGDHAELGIAVISGRCYTAWDLGRMLGLPALSTTWVLGNVSAKRRGGRIALRTGPCLGFTHRDLESYSALPPGIFSSRQASIRGSFQTWAVIERQRNYNSLGLKLNLENLWRPDELVRMSELLSCVEASVHA